MIQCLTACILQKSLLSRLFTLEVKKKKELLEVHYLP